MGRHEVGRRRYTASMGSSDNRAGETTAWRTGRQRLRLECRECEIICERVIYPWQCLKSECSCIYSYADTETTYFGCLHKVFSPELDLAAFTGERRLPDGQSGRPKGSDPYGPIRVARTPRPQCHVRIEHAYEALSVGRHCCNPTFFHHPLGPVDDEIRLFIRRPHSEPGSVG